MKNITNVFNTFVGREFAINKKMQWHTFPQLDSLEHYNKNKLGKLKTYEDPLEVEYEYNSYGFRTAEFEPNQSVDLLSAGCSFTEGIGLRANDVWDSVFAKKIGTKTHISLGMGGAGIETISRFVSVAINELKLKPKIIFVLFPDILRREGFINNLAFNEHIFNFLPQASFYDYPGYNKTWKAYVENLNIKDRFYAMTQNILFMQALAKSINATFVWDTWSSFTSTLDLKSTSAEIKEMIDPIFGLKVFDIFPHILPNSAKETQLSRTCLWHMHDDQIIDEYKIHSAQIARDFSHPGPNSHNEYANRAYEILKSRI